MVQQMSGRNSLCRPNRRALLRSAAALLSAPLVAKTNSAWAKEKLAGTGEVVAFSYGGSWTDGVRRNVYDPFTKATGIRVVDVNADNPEPQIMAMNRAGRIDWDVVYTGGMTYPSMHDAGMFVPIDYSLWDAESLQGISERDRFTDAVVLFQYAEVLAYDQRAFPNGGPKDWVDFWDVKKFPGPRGLEVVLGRHTIQFALLAAGVAPNEIWPLTDEKLDRAFQKLNEINPYITKWWSAGGEAPQLFMNREYATAAAFDGRLIGMIRDAKAPIKFVWDGAYLGRGYAAILKGGPNTTNAQKLVAFMNRAKIAAGWTLGTRSPGPNINQLKYLPADLVPLLSVDPENASKCIIEDDAWLGAKRPNGKTNGDHLQERWLSWRA